ncbi:MAG: DUF805 domain-containing protein [Methylotenera sp.]|jgi:uncharacterized membrane protein YhaH (DUF805 family)|nr:DUF805 domain-containing protein [Methylotenera sp.]
MNFQESIRLCFQKYADFNGRAKKPEYWWFFLFCFLVALLLEVVASSVSWIFTLATLIPSFAVGSRRLHDTNKSGWFQLLWLIPLLGWIAMIYLLVQESDAEANQYGESPTS